MAGLSYSWRDPMREFLGPGHPDQLLRQTVQMCWQVLPRERRNVEELTRQMQRLLDRAIRDLEEDRKEFEM
jgi:hypothetical protein